MSNENTLVSKEYFTVKNEREITFLNVEKLTMYYKHTCSKINAKGSYSMEGKLHQRETWNTENERRTEMVKIY